MNAFGIFGLDNLLEVAANEFDADQAAIYRALFNFDFYHAEYWDDGDSLEGICFQFVEGSKSIIVTDVPLDGIEYAPNQSEHKLYVFVNVATKHVPVLNLEFEAIEGTARELSSIAEVICFVNEFVALHR